MNGKLLFQSVMEPVIMFVSSADPHVSGGGDDAVSHETLYAFKLLLLLWVLDFNCEGL